MLKGLKKRYHGWRKRRNKANAKLMTGVAKAWRGKKAPWGSRYSSAEFARGFGRGAKKYSRRARYHARKAK